MDQQETETKLADYKKCLHCGECVDVCTCSEQRVTSFDPWIGRIINDQYEIESLIARGGMGAVYRAKHLLLGTTRAIKVIRPDVHLDENVYQRFKLEAQAVSGLSDPGIVSFHDFGIADSSPYVVMDLLEGHGLDETIKNRGRLEIKEALPIFVQVAEALGHAHSKGIFHRDIKPSNIMLVADNAGNTRAKVLDFGIAKITGGSDAVKLTSTGEVFGSPAYMSPEQARGEQIDGRSDIYSFGCVMFEALMGDVPFKANNALSTIMMHMNDAAPRITQSGKPAARAKNGDKVEKIRAVLRDLLPNAGVADPIFHDMDAIVARCLDKSPDRRYQTMAALAADLQRLNYGERLLHLQREMSRQRYQSIVSRSYNGLLIAFAVLLVPFAIWHVYFGSWRTDLTNALKDLDNSEKIIQHIMVNDLPQDDNYHWNKGYLMWHQAQLLRVKSEQNAAGLKTALNKYNNVLDELKLYAAQIHGHGPMLRGLSADTHDGLAQAYLSLAMLEPDYKTKRDAVILELKKNPKAKLDDNYLYKAMEAADLAVAERRESIRLHGMMTDEAVPLVQSLLIMTAIRTELKDYRVVEQALDEAFKDAHRFVPNGWLQAECDEAIALNALHLGMPSDALRAYKNDLRIKESMYGANSIEVVALKNKIASLSKSVSTR